MDKSLEIFRGVSKSTGLALSVNMRVFPVIRGWLVQLWAFTLGVIKSNFVVYKCFAHPVGLNAGLPQEGRTEEWRSGEEEVSLTETMMDLWLPLKGARRVCAICELGQVT